MKGLLEEDQESSTELPFRLHRPIKVLVISATFPPMTSGGADHAYQLCQRLADAGFEINVVTSCIEDVATTPKFQVHPVMAHWSWLEAPRLLGIARRFRPDVIHLHFTAPIYHNHPMITFVASILKKSMPTVRFVTQIEYPAGVKLNGLRTRVLRKVMSYWVGRQRSDYEFGTLLRDSDRIIVLCGGHRDMLSECLEDVNGKCVVIPPPPILRLSSNINGDARRDGRRLLGLREDEFVAAFYGYLYPGKGVETLFAAVAHLAEQGKRLRLLLVGGGNEVVLKGFKRPDYIKELKGMAVRLGIDRNVTWTGYYPKDSDEASVLLFSADACILPFDAGVALHRSSLAAACAHGLPIITTQGESLEPEFLDRKNVLLCAPKDPQGLANKIQALMADPTLQQELRQGSLQLSEEYFSWKKTLAKTVNAFIG